MYRMKKRADPAFTSAEVRHASKSCSRGRFYAISYALKKRTPFRASSLNLFVRPALSGVPCSTGAKALYPDRAAIVFLSVYIVRVCQSPIFHQIPAEVTAGCAAYLPKYRLSSPANALPWRASSRAISCTVSWIASRLCVYVQPAAAHIH